MIISFGWTAAALLAGEKSTTFREWAPRHVAHFHAGQIVDAWDRPPTIFGMPTKRRPDVFGLSWFGGWAAADASRLFWVVRFDVLGLEGGL